MLRTHCPAVGRAASTLPRVYSCCIDTRPHQEVVVRSLTVRALGSERTASHITLKEFWQLKLFKQRASERPIEREWAGPQTPLLDNVSSSRDGVKTAPSLAATQFLKNTNLVGPVSVRGEDVHLKENGAQRYAQKQAQPTIATTRNSLTHHALFPKPSIASRFFCPTVS